MDKKEVIKTSPFLGVPGSDKTKHENVNTDEDIIDYAVVNKSIKTGDGPYDFIIVPEVIEVGRRSRQAELNKYAPDVGCVNVINKLAKQGINAGDGRFAASPGFVDATKLPQDLESLTALSKELDPMTSAAWKALPPELKKNMDMKTFAKQYNTKMLQDFIREKFVKKTEVKPQEGETK